MIKKIKIANIVVKEEKEITSTKPKTLGKKYKLCEVLVKVADDCPEYAGKWIKTSIFEYLDPKDPKKNRTALDGANYFKSQNNEKEVLLDVEETKSISAKDGKEYTNYSFKKLSKAQAEVAAQFIK